MEREVDLVRWQDVVSSVRELKALNQSYDQGNFEIARSTSTVLHRLLSEELKRTRVSDLIIFPLLGAPYDKRGMLKFHGLIGAKITNLDFKETGYWSEITYEPMHSLNFGHSSRFKNWLKSVAIAFPSSDQVFSRRRIVYLARTKVGAHTDLNKGDDFDTAFSNELSFNATRLLEDGTELWSDSHPEYFKLASSPLGAMIRTISEEVVIGISIADAKFSTNSTITS